MKASEIPVGLRLLILKTSSGTTVCENREWDYARREVLDELDWLTTLYHVYMQRRFASDAQRSADSDVAKRCFKRAFSR